MPIARLLERRVHLSQKIAMNLPPTQVKTSQESCVGTSNSELLFPSAVNLFLGFFSARFAFAAVILLYAKGLI